jgi:hypothetical protein
VLSDVRCHWLRDNSFSAFLGRFSNPCPLLSSIFGLTHGNHVPSIRQSVPSFALQCKQNRIVAVVKQCVTNLLSSHVHTDSIRGASRHIHTEIFPSPSCNEKTYLHLSLLKTQFRKLKSTFAFLLTATAAEVAQPGRALG